MSDILNAEDTEDYKNAAEFWKEKYAEAAASDKRRIAELEDFEAKNVSQLLEIIPAVEAMTARPRPTPRPGGAAESGAGEDHSNESSKRP